MENTNSVKTEPLQQQLAQTVEANRTDLANLYSQGLRKSLFTNRSEMRPSLMKSIAADEVDALLNFLRVPGFSSAEHGLQLCQAGLGEQALLGLGQTTRQFFATFLEPGLIAPALEIGDTYQNAVTQGFIQGLGKIILAEQEQIRSAFELAISHYTVQIEEFRIMAQKEAQARGLLQQERDLLEQRVDERTRDLAEARDAAIQSSNEMRKYFLAMEQSGNAIFITDTKGNIEYANPKFEALTGYTRAETLGENPRILKSGEQDDAYYKDLWGTISAGKIWHGELRNRRKDGSLLESATIAPLINDAGKITNYVAIKEDITAQKELQEQLREQNEALIREISERKRTEALLQESEARFRQIVENASDIIYRTDVQGYLTYVNPTTLRLMHVKDDSDLIGKHYLEIAIPTARHKLKRFYNHQFLAHTQATYYEFPAITHDGNEIWLGQNVQLISDDDKIIGFQAVARDITAIKQTQEALSISRDQALEASSLKSQLLSRVSHELRTPLGAILGYAELLAMNAFGELNEEQKDAATQIMKSADYLGEMVNDLLDQAQAESKKISLHQTMFSPASMLQKVQANMEILAHNKGLEFSTNLAPELPELLFGDEHRLQQILINLAGNAVKFTRTGWVEVKIYQASPTQWAMQVADTGAGIPTEAQNYIFEPFRQVDNSITRENRGTGLGLSITKQLVELMDGEISVESEPGQGSTFTITLPILRKPERSA